MKLKEPLPKFKCVRKAVTREQFRAGSKQKLNIKLGSKSNQRNSSRNSEYFNMNKHFQKQSGSFVRRNIKTFLKKRSKLREIHSPNEIINNNENTSLNPDSTFIDSSQENSPNRNNTEFVDSYFNIEIKSRKEKRTVVYSTLERNINQTARSKKSPTENHETRSYKNIKCTPRKRCITPSSCVPVQPVSSKISHKGMVPSMPQKCKNKKEFYKSSGSNTRRGTRNFTTLLEGNKMNMK